MRVLLFGTYDTRTHPRIGTIAEGLRERGVDVGECNAPLGLDTAARVRLLAEPWRLPAMAARLASRWATLAWRAPGWRDQGRPEHGRPEQGWPEQGRPEHGRPEQGWRRRGWRKARGAGPDAVAVGYLGHFDVHLARLLFPRALVVLDYLVSASGTGRDRGLDGGPRKALLRWIDAAALRAADVVVVDTEEHRQTLPDRYRDRAVVVPVGAPAGWFGTRTAREEGPLRVIFFGLYTPLQGAPVIGEALALIASTGIEVTMAGTGQDYATTRAAADGNDRVRWLDWVPAGDLPALVAGHDVCLGIFGTGDKARRVVPNKVFQGAAAGCAIVTSDTPPQRRALGDDAILVPPGDAKALACALRDLAADPAALLAARGRARSRAERAFAPGAVVAPLMSLLESGPRGRPAAPATR
jgi:glycosyltransferase involved in cell wall biosynthesis